MIMDIRRFLRAAGDVVLPRRCVVCGCRLYLAEDFICLGCLMDMPLTRYWERARNPMADRFNERIQKRLEEGWPTREMQEEEWPTSGETRGEGVRTEGEHYAYAAALFFYHSEAGYRHIPYQIKYHGNIVLGEYFGRMLGQKLAGGGEEGWQSVESGRWTAELTGEGGQTAGPGGRVWEDVDMVVPVPLHWARRWKRGYNQAEVIARGVAEAMGVPVRTDILERRRRTKTQVRVGIEEKGRNVSGAFAVTEAAQREFGGRATWATEDGKKAKDAGCIRHILLVDDVFTTGSTLEACHNALRAVFMPPVRISAVTLGCLKR